MFDPNDEVNFRFLASEAQTLRAILVKQPFEVSATLIQKMDAQAQQQLQARSESPPRAFPRPSEVS
jgi:hypothetical protein